METVALLSKLRSEHHIKVDLQMDELEATLAETKATYVEIREWIQERYGFHVSNLNIAQIKRKLGIIERENYNLLKSENPRVPRCPIEKEAAIVNAFQAFQMI